MQSFCPCIDVEFLRMFWDTIPSFDTQSYPRTVIYWLPVEVNGPQCYPILRDTSDLLVHKHLLSTFVQEMNQWTIPAW